MAITMRPPSGTSEYAVNAESPKKGHVSVTEERNYVVGVVQAQEYLGGVSQLEARNREVELEDKNGSDEIDLVLKL